MKPVQALGCLLAALPFSTASLALAQESPPAEFTLFAAIDQPEAETRTDVNRATVRQANAAGAPVFTLVGVSRIGERRALILQHRDGEEVSMALDSSGQASVPGYGQYQVMDASGRAVGLRYPPSVPCREFAELGVHCADDTQGQLQMTNAAPLPVSRGQDAGGLGEQGRGQRGEQSANQRGEQAETAADGEPTNPFEAIRQRARAGQTAETDPEPNSQRFGPRRIAPEDVPPGMRKVSTPFGDRLVPE